jgi:hypothetical protein
LPQQQAPTPEPLLIKDEGTDCVDMRGKEAMKSVGRWRESFILLFIMKFIART